MHHQQVTAVIKTAVQLLSPLRLRGEGDCVLYAPDGECIFYFYSTGDLVFCVFKGLYVDYIIAALLISFADGTGLFHIPIQQPFFLFRLRTAYLSR